MRALILAAALAALTALPVQAAEPVANRFKILDLPMTPGAVPPPGAAAAAAKLKNAKDVRLILLLDSATGETFVLGDDLRWTPVPVARPAEPAPQQ